MRSIERSIAEGERIGLRTFLRPKILLTTTNTSITLLPVLRLEGRRRPHGESIHISTLLHFKSGTPRTLVCNLARIGHRTLSAVLQSALHIYDGCKPLPNNLFCPSHSIIPLCLRLSDSSHLNLATSISQDVIKWASGT